MDGFRNAAVRHPSYCTTIVPATIPGDGKGNTCGRLGGLHYDQGTYAIVYQRKPCRLLNADTNTYVVNTSDELALLTFTFNTQTLAFSAVKKTVLLTVSDLIMSVRSGKYGNKIFISYASQKISNGVLTSNNNYYVGTDITNYMLVGFNGVVATSTFVTPLNNTPLSDELRYLQDGRLVWQFIDYSQNLWLYYTTSPPLIYNTSFVETAEKEKEKEKAKANTKFLSHKK